MNVALLSRDLLAGDGSLISAIVVLISTALYSFAALAIAAKLFAAEALLFDARLGWGDLWKRPLIPVPPAWRKHFFAWHAVFPVSFAALGGISNLGASLNVKFILMSLATAIVYGGVPFLFAHGGESRGIPA